MKERCDQQPDCRDKSDEVSCHLLVRENNYNKKIPPVVPTQVNVSLVLKKVVEIEEVDHSIHLKFQIILEWKETRTEYHNLNRGPHSCKRCERFSRTNLNLMDNFPQNHVNSIKVLHGNYPKKN